MKKILIVSTVCSQLYLFNQGNIEVLKSLGYEIHAAANYSDENERLDELDIIRHPFDIQRSPLSLKNIKAYKQLKKIMRSEEFIAVHCQSPMGGVLARLAAKAIGIPNVIYTAHGFHFFKGAPRLNWLVYYPIEKFLARYTDVLITINQEDYIRAQKFKAKKVVYIPGAGVDIKKFSGLTINRDKKREELGIPKDAFVVISVGELNKNKNHQVVVKAIEKIDNPSVYYLICGQGNNKARLKNLADMHGISERVLLLGFRNDVHEIYNVADIFAFPSYREGLPMALMEAMSAGLPVICSSVRGNTDLIESGKGGYLLEPEDVDGITECMLKVIGDAELRKSMAIRNMEKVMKYDKSVVKAEIEKIYESFKEEQYNAENVIAEDICMMNVTR